MTRAGSDKQWLTSLLHAANVKTSTVFVSAGDAQSLHIGYVQPTHAQQYCSLLSPSEGSLTVASKRRYGRYWGRGRPNTGVL